jgi:DNA-binding transcriptional regulator/RsmH inhibitor MraZ
MSKQQSQKQTDAIKAQSIMHAIEVKSSFELYAYRIISHEQYVERIQELIALFNKAMKSQKNSTANAATANVDENGQLSIPAE